ncbi:MAG: SAM-dependent methyltransferase [Clostridiaceae bacterium]|jgi:tRNA (adenine22-N1)-methyltransferase|nr:SAM-dependent methyltransferase [Clostridiaceae bacterium]
MKDNNQKQTESCVVVGNARLDLLIRLVREVPCQRLIDVGSDHATVPIQLRKLNYCSRVLVTDLRKGPLSMAVRRAAEEGITEGFDAVQADGLDGIEFFSEDVLLISGLGGQTIVRILERNAQNAKIPKRMILQPQTHPEILRAMLCERGFAISDERCVHDRGQTYLVIVCDRNDEPLSSLSPLQAYIGPVILSRLKETTARYRCLDDDENHDRDSIPDVDNEDYAIIEYLRKRKRRLDRQAPYRISAKKLLRELNLFTSGEK